MSETLFKVLALCIVASVLAVILKQKSSEYALLISVAVGAVIGIILLNNLFAPIRQISEYISKYGVKTEGFKVALKAVGIGYVTSFVSDSCKSCGQASMAATAELAGKCAIFLLSVPLMLSVLETAVGFIK